MPRCYVTAKEQPEYLVRDEASLVADQLHLNRPSDQLSARTPPATFDLDVRTNVYPEQSRVASPTEHALTLAPGCHGSRLHEPQITRFCAPFAFILLRIAFSASPLL